MCVRAGLEEALEADAAEGGDEEAGRLRGLLSALDQGVPAPGKREDSERQRCAVGRATTQLFGPQWLHLRTLIRNVSIHGL
jgi:hypothetical protein